MPRRDYASKSELQDALDEAVERLVALGTSRIVRQRFLDENDPDDLEALAVLTLDLARACDPIFHEIACRGGIGPHVNPGAHAADVTGAVAGNLDFELRDRAERLAAWRDARDPDDEHRLSAVELGVGLSRRR